MNNEKKWSSKKTVQAPNYGEEIHEILSLFNPKWITEGIDGTLVLFAEKAGKFMAPQNKKEERFKLSKSQIRNVYGEIKRIQVAGFEKERNSFILLKPKVAYAFGRKKESVGLKLFKNIFDLCYEHVKDSNSFKNFCNLIEALLAYHKFYGGKD